MKIQYLAFIRLPTEKAHGVQIVKTCEALASLGHEVELVIPGRQTHILGDAFSYYGAKKNFTITSLHTPDWVNLGPLGFFVSLLWFSEAAKWRKAFWDADVVFSRDAGVLLQYVLLGRPLVYEAHNDPSLASLIVARFAQKVVTISKGLKDEYAKRGIRVSKIAVIPDAVDPAHFEGIVSKVEARKRFHIPEGAVALYVGKIDAMKGADTFTAASAKLADIKAVIVGWGPLAKELASRYPTALFLPPTPYAELPALLSAADVLVLPNSGNYSESARNTSPLKLFAYMASGIPIVASDVPAIREVLDDDAAVYVMPDAPDALADGIVKAIATPGIGSIAKARAKKYTWTARAEKLLSAMS